MKIDDVCAAIIRADAPTRAAIRFLAQATLAAAIIGAPPAYYFIFVMTP